MHIWCMEYMNEATDELIFHNEHVYLMYEYMFELILECMTKYAIVMDAKL